MGGRALGADQALIDLDFRCYAAEVALKRTLLQDAPREYFSGGPQTVGAQWAVLELVTADLARHYPEQFRLEKVGRRWHWHNLLLGEQHTLIWGDQSSLPLAPLDWTGRQVQEDLVLVSADADAKFVGGQLCFPNGWDLADRLGQPFMTVHARTPVTTMPSVSAGARLLSAMKPGKTIWRLSWNFKLSDQLDMSTKYKAAYKADFAARVPHLTPATAGREIFIRVERQTFTRLIGSDCVLFGIHTYNSALKDEVADSARARRLLSVLKGTPDDVKHYKAIAPIEGVMLAYIIEQLAMRERVT